MAPVPVAQYLRMSTEMQQYSLDNQADAICRYAAAHDFQVVKTYADAAKSGLRLKNRRGLQQLLQDVVAGKADFRAVLVYDISRWGRFQDVDEAAHYEYLCKSAGIPVHYCAERFANDDTSLPVAIMKALRRTMAGEYSRDLSAKVWNAQMRIARLGFKMGGYAIYGLRRLLIDKEGKPKQLLAVGERKSLVTDRVIVVPGPPEEVSTVRRIFHEFADEHRSLLSIAARLNREHIPFALGNKWDQNSVRRTLLHPHYVGTQVWGRTTSFLASAKRDVPIEQWVLRPNAFQPIVDQALFDRAQARFADFPHNLSDDELLRKLRVVLQRNGRLNTKIIESSPLCPSLSTYFTRFGGLMQVYRRMGYPSSALQERIISTRQHTWMLRRNLFDEVLQTFSGDLEEVRIPRSIRSRLKVRKTRQLVSVTIARYYLNARGMPTWRVQVPRKERRSICLVAILDSENRAIERLMLFRNMTGHGRTIYFCPKTEALKSALQLNAVAELLQGIQNLRDSDSAPPKSSKRLQAVGNNHGPE